METAAVLRVLGAPLPFRAELVHGQPSGTVRGLPWHPAEPITVSVPGATIHRLAGRVEFDRPPAGLVTITGLAMPTAIAVTAERCYVEAGATYSDRLAMMGKRTSQSVRGKLLGCRYVRWLKPALEAADIVIVDLLLPGGGIEMRAWAQIGLGLGHVIEWAGVPDADGHMVMSFRDGGYWHGEG